MTPEPTHDARPTARTTARTTAPDPASITTAQDWVDGLRALQDRAGLSVREIARRSRGSASTIGGYLSGRHLPTPVHRELVERMLTELGVHEAAEREAWLEALARVRRSPEPRPAEEHAAEPAESPAGRPAPYRGLAEYTVEDAAWFVGREGLTARLVELARRDPERLIMVVGPSGSGKSSALAAGLGATLVAEGWTCRTVTPGTDPLARIPREATPGTLLVVDQLEELWTQGAPPVEVHEALQRIHRLAASPGTVVAAGLRADFYAQALQQADLARSLQDLQVVVGPMDTAELTRVITEPAARARLRVDDALVEVVLRDLAPAPGSSTTPDAAHDPGALPLLGYALLQTWQRGAGTRLTVPDYHAAGGIRQAVAAAAEAAYAAPARTPLPEEEREELTRRVFLRLVSVSEDAADTRRRVDHGELLALGEQAAEVAERFVRARLLTATLDSVEITHEALLTAWPRLRAWLDADRVALLTQHRLIEAARAWQTSGHDPGLLLRGVRLEAARELAADPARGRGLTELERRFVEAAEAARQAEDDDRRRRTRRLQLLSVVLALALVGLAVLAGLGRRLQTTAQHDRDLALSRQLAEAATRVRAVDPTLAGQFALLGYRTAPTVESRSALLDTTAMPLARRIDGPGGLPSVAISATGLVAAAGDRGGLRLWRLAHGQDAAAPLADLPSVQQAPLYTVAVTPDGRFVAAAGGGTGVVHVWDTTDPAAPRALPGVPIGDLRVLALAFAPDGRTLAAAGLARSGTPDAGGQVLAWRVPATGATFAPVVLPPLGEQADDTTLQALAFSPDSGTLAVGGAAGLVHRVSLTGAPALRTPTLTGDDGAVGTVTSLAWSPDGARLAAGSKDQAVHLWDLRSPTGSGTPSGTPSRKLTGASSWVNTVAFSPDGGHLVAGSSDSHLRFYDAVDGTPYGDVGSPGPVTAAAYTPDGAALLTGASDGRLRQWALPLPVAPSAGGRTFSLAHPTPGTLVALTSSNALRAFAIGPSTLRPISPVLTAPGRTTRVDGFAGTFVLAPEQRLALASGRDGTNWLYRLTDAGVPRPIATLPRTQRQLIETGIFLDRGRVVLTASDDQTVQATDVSVPTRPTVLGTPMTTDGVVYSMALTPDGRTLAVGRGDRGAVDLWDVSDPRRIRVVATAPAEGGPGLQAYGMAFAPDGQTLAVASSDTTLRLLDVADRAAPRWTGSPVTGAGDGLFAVQYAPDGSRIATASADGTLRLYTAGGPNGDPRPVAALTASGPQAVYSVAFAPGGAQVSAGGASQTVTTWSLDPGVATDRLCAWLGAPITEAEWRRHVPSVPYTRPCDGR